MYVFELCLKDLESEILSDIIIDLVYLVCIKKENFIVKMTFKIEKECLLYIFLLQQFVSINVITKKIEH